MKACYRSAAYEQEHPGRSVAMMLFLEDMYLKSALELSMLFTSDGENNRWLALKCQFKSICPEQGVRKLFPETTSPVTTHFLTFKGTR